MADEPSMDEILASLDRLLKEGEGRNDEPSEPSQQTPSKEQAEEPVEEPTQKPVPGFLTDSGEAAAEESPRVSQDSEPGVAEKASGGGSELDQAAVAWPGPAESAVPRRIVLTDAMMVDDVQQPLPLPIGDTTPAKSGIAGSTDPESGPAEAESAPGEPSRAVAWDARDIQALVDQVTDDVCSAMADQLPDLIRQALAQRLTSFVVDRTQNQDSEAED